MSPPERTNSATSSSAGDDTKGTKLALETVRAEVGKYDASKFAVAPNGELIDIAGTGGTDLVTKAAPAGIPQRGGKVWNRDDWLKMKNESWARYLYRLTFEGHTVFDAFLLVACGQIGQIMLTNPWALYSAGVVSGGVIWAWSLFVGIWTVWNYVSLYLEYKRAKIKDGSWWETNGEHRYIVQWFEVVGFHLGEWARWVSMIIVCLSLTGTAVVQTVASANSYYTIDPSRSKREWSLIFGGSMVFLVVFIPRFTKFRLLSVIGLLGTMYAAFWAVEEAGKKGRALPEQVNLYPVTPEMRPGTLPVQNWFNGVAILIGETGGHSLIIESMESMESPGHYRKAYTAGIMAILLVTVPHAFALNFSGYAPKLNFAQNMFSLFPVDNIKRAAVVLMIIHHYIAYLLYGTQMCIAVEKMVGVHTQAYWKRALLRLPIACIWWFLSLVLPFYGAINSLLTSLGGSLVSFVLLAISSIKLYRNKEARDNAVVPPYKWLQWKNWTLVHIINIHIAIFYLGFGCASLYYAILTVKQQAKTWGFLPECYGC